MDHTFWNGYGHAYDRHALVSIDSLETPLLFVSVSLGVLNWALLVARTRLCYYKASRWCQWLAYAQGELPNQKGGGPCSGVTAHRSFSMRNCTALLYASYVGRYAESSSCLFTRVLELPLRQRPHDYVWTRLYCGLGDGLSVHETFTGLQQSCITERDGLHDRDCRCAGFSVARGLDI